MRFSCSYLRFIHGHPVLPKYPNIPKKFGYMKKVSYEGLSEYSKNIEQLRRQIFNDVVTPTEKTNMRVVERFSYMPLNKNPHYVRWYPRIAEIGRLLRIFREYGLYRDEHLDFKEEYARLRILRGKTPWRPKHVKTGERITFKKPDYTDPNAEFLR